MKWFSRIVDSAAFNVMLAVLATIALLMFFTVLSNEITLKEKYRDEVAGARTEIELLRSVNADIEERLAEERLVISKLRDKLAAAPVVLSPARDALVLMFIDGFNSGVRKNVRTLASVDASKLLFSSKVQRRLRLEISRIVAGMSEQQIEFFSDQKPEEEFTAQEKLWVEELTEAMEAMSPRLTDFVIGHN